MQSLAKKCKRKIKKAFRNIFSCIFLQKEDGKGVKDHDGDRQTVFKPTRTVESLFSHKLEGLLLKTLEQQLEDRQYQRELKNALVCVTNLLEHLGRHYHLNQTFSRVFSGNDEAFKFKLSKDNLINCHSELERKKLNIVPENSIGAIKRQQSIELHKCPYQVFGSDRDIERKNSFPSVLLKVSVDKAVQHNFQNCQTLPTSLINHSFFQKYDNFFNLSTFNISSFKINLIDHMKNLKKDVITLRQLLFTVENIQNKGLFENSPSYWGECYGKSDESWKMEQFHYKFFEARVRAANFVKFYRLRKIDDKKKKKGMSGRRWIQ